MLILVLIVNDLGANRLKLVAGVWPSAVRVERRSFSQPPSVVIQTFRRLYYFRRLSISGDYPILCDLVAGFSAVNDMLAIASMDAKYVG